MPPLMSKLGLIFRRRSAAGSAIRHSDPVIADENNTRFRYPVTSNGSDPGGNTSPHRPRDKRPLPYAHTAEPLARIDTHRYSILGLPSTVLTINYKLQRTLPSGTRSNQITTFPTASSQNSRATQPPERAQRPWEERSLCHRWVVQSVSVQAASILGREPTPWATDRLIFSIVPRGQSSIQLVQ